MEDDIDLELGQGKAAGQLMNPRQGEEEDKAAKTTETGGGGGGSAEDLGAAAGEVWNSNFWNWKEEVPFLLLGVLYVALGVVVMVLYMTADDAAGAARKKALWGGGSMVAFGAVVLLRFVAGIFFQFPDY